MSKFSRYDRGPTETQGCVNWLWVLIFGTSCESFQGLGQGGNVIIGFINSLDALMVSTHYFNQH